MSEWQIVERRRDSVGFAAIADGFRDPVDHPYMGEFGRRIHPTYFPPGATVDVSFALCRRQVPVALVEALLEPTGLITRAGQAVRIQFGDETANWRAVAIGTAFDHVLALARAAPQRADHIEFEDLAMTDDMTPTGLWAMKRGGHPAITPWPIIELQRPEAELWRAVRKSYRPLIRWGERHLTLIYYNREVQRVEDLERGLAFLAGLGVVLDPRTFSVYHDFVQRGQGEFTMVEQHGQTIGFTIIIDDGLLGFYALAYYQNETREFPIAHWPLWNAILRCRARGRLQFELYRIFFRGQERLGYRLGVAQFKLGFTDTVRQRLLWRVPVAEAGLAAAD